MSSGSRIPPGEPGRFEKEEFDARRTTRSKTKAEKGTQDAAQSALVPQETPRTNKSRRVQTPKEKGNISLGLGTEKGQNLPTDIQKHVAQFLTEKELGAFAVTSRMGQKIKADLEKEPFLAWPSFIGSLNTNTTRLSFDHVLESLRDKKIKITVEMMEKIFKKAPNIDEIDLRNEKVPMEEEALKYAFSKGIGVRAKTESLGDFACRGDKEKDPAFEKIKYFSLEIEFIVSDSDIDELDASTIRDKIKELKINCCCITRDGWGKLSKFPLLEKVEIAQPAVLEEGDVTFHRDKDGKTQFFTYTSLPEEQFMNKEDFHAMITKFGWTNL